LTIPLPYKYRGGGVAVFRTNNGQAEVLLGLRANNPGRGLWSFPGGEAEGEEKLSSAAIREFREETGVQLYRRYITSTGLFQVKTLFFEWNTLIIESSQYINAENRFKPSTNKSESGLGHKCFGEFISIQWVPVTDLANYKLHRWVKDVVNFYTSGKTKPYTAKPPKNEIKILPEARKQNRARTIKRVTGESLLFDIAEMVLTKVDRDGTKYFQPSYQVQNKHSVIQEAFHGV